MSNSKLLPENAHILPSGTRLFRVHKNYFQSTLFNERQASENNRDGRFDSDGDDYYPFYYAALSDRGAIYETLIAERHTSLGEPIPRDALKHRTLSIVEVAKDLRLLSLRTARDFDLAGQSEWLVRSSPCEYPRTRYQVRVIRSRFRWAEGLIWYSRKSPDEQSLVLFGDRCGVDSLRKTKLPAIALDAPSAESWLTQILAPHTLDR
jgi:hypothetical protein